MVHKGSKQLVHQNSSVGNGVKSNWIEDEDLMDPFNSNPPNEVTNRNFYNDTDGSSGTSGAAAQSRSQQLRLAVLVWIFVEKFFEILFVFFFTLLAILWEPLFNLIHRMFWPLIGFIAGSMIALIGLNRIPWFTRAPGCFLYKLLYLIFLTTVFFILAVHFPIPLPFLDSYFALVAAGTAAATYILLACITIAHEHICKVDAQGCVLWLYGLVMPIVVLIVSQPVYFYCGIWETVEYKKYMVNITAGIFVSLPFTYETLFIYQSFVSSNIWEEFARTPGLLPGFVTAVAQKRDMEVRADKNGDVETKIV